MKRKSSILSDSNKLQVLQITWLWSRRANHCISYWTPLSVKTVRPYSQVQLITLLGHTESRNIIIHIIKLPFWTFLVWTQRQIRSFMPLTFTVLFSSVALCVCGFLHERRRYATFPPHQVWHTDGGVLRGVRRERRAARAIFKATMRVTAEVGSDAALCCTPADTQLSRFIISFYCRRSFSGEHARGK